MEVFLHPVRGRKIPDWISRVNLGMAPKCNLCHSRANALAYWTGSGDSNVAVCLECAIETLPKLMADAVAAANRPSGLTEGVFASAWKEAEKSFLMASKLATGRHPTPLDVDDSTGAN